MVKLSLVVAVAFCVFGTSLAQDVDPAEPLVRCRRQMCSDSCEFGFEIGEDGCPTCDCKPDPCLDHTCAEGERCYSDCVLGSCEIQCTYDQANCPMLKCVPCESGRYFKDQHGCQTCDCMPAAPGSSVEEGPSLACPMPMCADACAAGYRTDENGCMTCDCLPDNHPPVEFSCPDVMCAMFCENGFKKDEYGCNICRCREPTDFEFICSDMMCETACVYGYEKDEHGCDTCRCIEVAPFPQIPCPAAMCKMFCENGLEKNEFGCDICKCRESEADKCETVLCVEGMMCRPETGLCTEKSLCENMREMENEGLALLSEMFGEEVGSRDNDFECQADGSFAPRQCLGPECFCVDDRGHRVPEMDLLPEELMNDLCSDRISKMMRLSLDLMHDLDVDDLEDATEDVEELVRTAVGDWLDISPDTVIRVEVVKMGEGFMSIEIDILTDGSADLATAAHRMHRRVNDGGCTFPLGDHTISAKPGSMHAVHQYAQPSPPIGVSPTAETVSCFGVHIKRATLLVILPLLGLLILILIAVVCWRLCRKSGSYQFAHKRLESRETFRKNLILSSEWEKPELVCKDDVTVTIADPEKKALA